MKKKDGRGGARAGAGRKRSNNNGKYISKSISLPSGKWEELERKAAILGITKNKLVANLIDDFLEEKIIKRAD